jgi:hypothetical protein
MEALTNLEPKSEVQQSLSKGQAFSHRLALFQIIFRFDKLEKEHPASMIMRFNQHLIVPSEKGT